MDYMALGIENLTIVFRAVLKDERLAARQELILKNFDAGNFSASFEMADKAFEEAIFLKDGRPGVINMLQETKFTTLIYLLVQKIESAYKLRNEQEAKKNWNELKIIFRRPDLGKIFSGLYVFKFTPKLSNIFNTYDPTLSKEVAEIHRLIISS